MLPHAFDLTLDVRGQIAELCNLNITFLYFSFDLLIVLEVELVYQILLLGNLSCQIFASCIVVRYLTSHLKSYLFLYVDFVIHFV